MRNDAGGASGTCQAKVYTCNTNLLAVPSAARTPLTRMAQLTIASNATDVNGVGANSYSITPIKAVGQKFVTRLCL